MEEEVARLLRAMLANRPLRFVCERCARGFGHVVHCHRPAASLPSSGSDSNLRRRARIGGLAEECT